MKHRCRKRKLNRKSSNRKALFKSLMNSLIQHEMIKTTLPKAAALRPVAEKLITLAKEDNVARRRLIFSRLRDKQATAKLFTVIAPKSKDRPGGYLRILKCGYRQGDNAPMAVIQWVDSQLVADLQQES